MPSTTAMSGTTLRTYTRVSYASGPRGHLKCMPRAKRISLFVGGIPRRSALVNSVDHCVISGLDKKVDGWMGGWAVVPLYALLCVGVCVSTVVSNCLRC